MRRELRGWTGVRMPGYPFETKTVSGWARSDHDHDHDHDHDRPLAD